MRRRFYSPAGHHSTPARDLRGVFMKTTVDYSWELDAGVRTDVKVHPAVGVRGARSTSATSALMAAAIGAIKPAIKSRVACVSKGALARWSSSLPASVGSTRIRSSLALSQWVTAGFRLLSRSSGR